MASHEPHVLPRESESGASTNLTTGAIAGIACGAGALFLGAAGLFLIYWRRQRQFDREDNYYQDSIDERAPPGAMAPAVTYTMDYKMDDPQHHEGDQASSYVYSPEKPSYPFSPLSTSDTASAMPTHPAYIPRALVRGSSTPSNRSITTTSPPPFPSPPFPYSSSSQPKTQPDDTMIQAYLAAAAAAQNQDTTTNNVPADSDSSLSGLPISTAAAKNRQSPTQIPALHPTTTTTTTAPTPARKPRAYLPPRLNLPPGPAGPSARAAGAGDKPLVGKENTTISGPLAFPQHYQPPLPQQPPRWSGGGGGGGGGSGGGRGRSGWMRTTTTAEDEADDLWGGEGGGGDETAGGPSDRDGPSGGGGSSGGRRTFRSRALTASGNEGKKHGRKRSDRNSGGAAGGGGGGNRHYAEIEVGRGSDIW
ncbi:hypothetical protein NEMBOFW57_005127 [Staphylotrichum longicolle]|uniref:Uncharacterized protein n=1 Tax=Staphylotrichum longicolle TaxID=669026 RepID=A0AAD4EX36_9PEZI|nr:hypothetical protein NEMBOFW57_005127 [Staphylotrichum longicolle]